MPYSVQARNLIFAKGYGFLSFAKNMDKNFRKIQVNTKAVNTTKQFMTMLNNLPQMRLKLLQKEQFKKQQQQQLVA